ncbi:MAG: MmcQ/YjbR family DNA-binding protein [Parvularculaceae bacterium]|nr:MmcQ/YjbR family DNA-binding protein [Parvularculaceae bacterium]
MRAIALALEFPGVTEAISWGQPCLKAHGKLWFFWSPSENAPVFKVSFEERDILVESDPETFFFTDHYKNHQLVLARPERIDRAWIEANLVRVWRDMAPKRVLKKWDEEGGRA